MPQDGATQKAEPKTSRVKAFFRLLLQLWVVDRWIIEPIRLLAERDEPLISFGPKPKKKKVKATPIAWWQFWKSKPIKKAKAKKSEDAEQKSIWPGVLAFLVGGLVVWLWTRGRRRVVHDSQFVATPRAPGPGGVS